VRKEDKTERARERERETKDRAQEERERKRERDRARQKQRERDPMRLAQIARGFVAVCCSVLQCVARKGLCTTRD